MATTEQRPYIGGQAVIEGVMMRSPLSLSIVVRRSSGELVVRERPVARAQTSAALRWPFIRGVATLVEAIGLGSEALRFSSEIYERDHADPGTSAPPSGSASSKPGAVGRRALHTLAFWMAVLATHEPDPGSSGPAPTGSGEAGSGRRLFSLITIVIAVGMFVVLPQAAAAFTSRVAGLDLDLRSPLFQALTGAFKLTIVVGYLMLIRRIPEIRRVFQYHGAEHKTISTYEAGEPLAVSYAQTKSTLHPRCGTTFIVMVALVSIVVFTAVAPLLPRLHVSGFVENVLLLLLKLPFLIPIAAVTFEIQRVFARYCRTGPLRALLWPGFLVQKITTIEPDPDQLEVALSALRATLWREHAKDTAPVSLTDRTFRDFEALSSHPGYGHAA
jgi:uncharacterized protein YqhQ